MSSRFLACYTCGVLLVASVVATAITVLPGSESVIRIIFTVLITAAGVFAVIGGLLLWLPKAHWSNQSLRVRLVLSIAAVFASLSLFTCVG